MEAKELRRIAREKLADKWGQSIAVTLVAALLGGLVTGTGFNLEITEDLKYYLPEFVLGFLAVWGSVASILGVVQFVIGGTIQLGYAQYLLKQHDGADCQFNDLFSQFQRFGQGFAQHFLRVLYTVLWTLLFIIPGIIKNFSYAMTPFIMAENPDMTASEAITASKEMMDGHKADLFFLNLSFIGWELLNILTLGIGSLWLNPYMNAAHAAFYRNLKASYSANQVETPTLPE